MPRVLSRRGCLLGLMGAAAAPLPARAGARSPRIVATDLAATQTLLALGVNLAAIAQRRLYETICVEPAVPSGVLDLGLADEPNLELLVDIAPDLIVTGSDEAHVARLFGAAAPILSTRFGAIDAHPSDLAARETERLARHLGVEARGAGLISDLSRATMQCRAALAARPRKPLYVVTLMPNGRHAWVFGPGSLIQDVLTAAGLVNAWTRPVQAWGGAIVGIEALSAQGDAELVYIDDGENTRQALARLATSPLWTSLPFVNAGRIAPVPRFYLFGGLPAAIQFARRLPPALNRIGASGE